MTNSDLMVLMCDKKKRGKLAIIGKGWFKGKNKEIIQYIRYRPPQTATVM